MIAQDIIDKYIKFFEERGHKRIPNSPLVPQDDPTTLFTSAGMQPLIPYLLGQTHPQGKKLVNVQNSFRAQDIDEVGDNRHTTFFRMLGNWSLGDYFKKEEIPWLWEFLTRELGLPKDKLYISVFEGYKEVPKDTQSYKIWEEVLEAEGLRPKERIFFGGVSDNWWSRSGVPDNMPSGEIGGPDTEVYFDLKPDEGNLSGSFKELSDSGRLLEIANSVFIQYQKQDDGSFKELPQKNVDFGAGLERLLQAVENQSDIFNTSLFKPIIKAIESSTNKSYESQKSQMRILADHLRGASMIIAEGVAPSNKEQGYILRRLLRKSFDMWYELEGKDISSVLETIVEEGSKTDEVLKEEFEKIRNTILEEEQKYSRTLREATSILSKKYKSGDEIMGPSEISSEDAFNLYTSHGLSPTQIKSLGYSFNDQEFAELMKAHQNLSRAGAKQKFSGGLADHSEKTIMGHTATHLLHQALRDVLGNQVHQTGSNITSERLRFDFNYDKPLTDEEISRVEKIINEKIRENLPVHFEMLSLEDAKRIGAIGLFDEKYEDKVKVYFIGEYSKEFCGGPHVDFTGRLKKVKINKQENIGNGKRRIYATVEN